MASKFTQSLAILSYLVLIILLNIPNSISTPTYVYSFCSNTKHFANKSQYNTNLNNVLHYLTSNSTDPTGFHQVKSTFTKKTKNVTIYGHFLCRGDLSVTACKDCVTTATTRDLPKKYCPNRRKAIIWYEECMVRYSNHAFFGKLEQEPTFLMFNVNNVTGNVTQFKHLVVNMLNDRIPAQASSGGLEKKFATQVVSYSSSEKIYGMGQCTPDLSRNECRKCLKRDFNEMLVGRKGGRALNPSCIVRYEMYSFFNLASVPSSPPPPHEFPPSPQPSPTSDSPPAPPVSSPSPLPSPVEAPMASPQSSPPAPPVSPPSTQPSAADEPTPPPQSSPPENSVSPPDSPNSSDSPSAARSLYTPHYNMFSAIGTFMALNFFYNIFAK